MSHHPAPSKIVRGLIVVLAVISFAVILAAHHVSDGDLWGKLAIGAHVWKFGTVPQNDMFAFTPVLPQYIEHEWGAGTIFFGVLRFFGPAGLILLKILLAFGSLIAAMAAGRKVGCSWNTLFLLVVPVVPCLLPGYIPVIRSHAFTYCFFAFTLLALEEIRAGRTWPVFALPPILLVWSNVHGGFVAGLGAIIVYAVWSLFDVRSSVGEAKDLKAEVTQSAVPAGDSKQRLKLLLITAVACGIATLFNIYGLKFWAYLVPALLHKRPWIAEWQPMAPFGNDAFLGFRILFLLVVLLLIFAWRKTEKKSWPGLVMLALTAALAWRSRRHTPFFAVTALAFVGPFLQSVLSGMSGRLKMKMQPTYALAMLYGLVAIYAATVFLPRASFDVLAPIGHDPVREVDILSIAQAEGNLATPFGWGCYCSWRLYPRIKVSMDGRYETTYPESTFQMNSDFYDKRGTNWDRLVREYPVDYVLLEFTQERLRPQDLLDHGYVMIWQTEGHSALMALEKHAMKLRQIASNLSPKTINPLDATIPDKWWSH